MIRRKVVHSFDEDDTYGDVPQYGSFTTTERPIFVGRINAITIDVGQAARQPVRDTEGDAFSVGRAGRQK